MVVSGFGWTPVLVGLAVVGVGVSADLAWSGFRDWRHKRSAIKHGRTLTTKFGLPWD
jgi:hypothetical protein